MNEILGQLFILAAILSPVFLFMTKEMSNQFTKNSLVFKSFYCLIAIGLFLSVGGFISIMMLKIIIAIRVILSTPVN